MKELATVNTVNLTAFLGGFAIHSVEPTLTILALLSAITYNVVKIIKETKK
jgi:hypothetical protein